jgi:hypothetical protein
LEPVVSEGVETVIPPTPDVLTSPLMVAEVPAETFKAEALIFWVFSVVPVINVVAPVVVTVPPSTAEPEETSSVEALIA